jgi:hypothetical protein
MLRKIPYVILTIAMLIAAWTQAVHAMGEAAAPARPAPPVLTDTDFKPKLGTYYYCFEFNSMNIGTACIAIQHEGDLYTMNVNARTSSKIDYLYKIRYQGRSTLDTDPLAPKVTTISQTVKSKEKDLIIRFQGDGSIQTSETVTVSGEYDNSDQRRIHPERFTVDPFSATYLARGYEWKVGAEQTFDVYTGKKRYELHLKCVDKTLLDMNGSRRAAWVIVPSGRCLDDSKPADPKKKPADIKIYLSADDSKDVLRVEATHTMGTFLVYLDRFDPSMAQTKAVTEK